MIKEKEVEIIVSQNMIKYLKDLGYELPTHIYRGVVKTIQNVPFTIKVEHLKPKSSVKITRICDNCKEERIVSRAKYKPLCFKCSTYKIGLALTGENNGMFGKKGELSPRWNPNISSEEKLNNRRRFYSKELQRWSKWVKELYDFTCQKCKIRGGALVSHHIESWDACIELRHDISNGICFCNECHLDFHRIYGKGNNSRKQLIEFLEEK
jgi:hypothetical protein